MSRSALFGLMALLGCGSLAAAQAPAPAGYGAAPQTFTVVGCVQKESSVLKRNSVAGDAGMSDEFVLTNSKLNRGTPATETPPAAMPEMPKAPVGTSGSASNFGKVYRVTGDKESELKGFVGQRVEITGAFKHDEDAKAELSAIGTSGLPPSVELKPENTPEITIAMIRPVAASCSAGGAQ